MKKSEKVYVNYGTPLGKTMSDFESVRRKEREKETLKK